MPEFDTPTLETERLILRRFTLDDAEAVYAYGSVAEVALHTGFNQHQSIEDSLGFIRRELDHYAHSRPGTWAIVRKDTGRLVGGAGFVQVLPVHRVAEIGYVLHNSEWGQGLVPEAVRRILEYAFDVHGLNRVEAICKVPNTASARVMEKAGMRFEGILRGYRTKNGVPFDYKMYAILAEDRQP